MRMFGLDRMEGESNESDILIEGKLLGWGENMVLGKLPGSHKDDPR